MRIITSVRVLVGEFGARDRVRIFNRGAFAGEIFVTSGDGCEIARMLLGPSPDENHEGDVEFPHEIVFEPKKASRP